MKKHWPKLLIGAVILLIGAVVMTNGPDEATAELLVEPTVGPFRVTVTATGDLQAKNSVKIYGPRGARSARIYEMKILQLVPEGTVVIKGEFVAQLDQSELTSKIQDAMIDLQKAQSQYTQTQLDTSLNLSKARDDLINLRYATEEAKLRREQAVFEPPSVQRQAEIEFEKSERAHHQATNNYTTQEQQAVAKMSEVDAELSKTRRQHEDLSTLAQEFQIMAPENGMVIYKRDWRGQKTTVGGTVSAWDPVVATLPDLSVMESITYVNEVDIQKIQESQIVEIGLDADPDKRLNGVVSSIANIGEQRPNSDAKVFEVAIIVTEADSTLRPSMTTSNTIIVAEVLDALSIPLECIHTADSLNFVYVKDGGGLVRKEVKLGLLNENEAIVEGGLEADDQIFMSVPENGETAPLRQLEPSGEAVAKAGS